MYVLGEIPSAQAYVMMDWSCCWQRIKAKLYQRSL